MADPARARKVAERIKVLIAQGLDTLVKDPRLGFVTITDVRVTGDLQQATVFYTVLGGDQERADAAEVLQTYRGRLRSHMGKGLGIRLTPTLEFVPDALPEDAAHLEDVFRQVQERDAELAAGRAQGGYAGDADPYRKPREPEPAGEEPDDGRVGGEEAVDTGVGGEESVDTGVREQALDSGVGEEPDDGTTGEYAAGRD